MKLRHIPATSYWCSWTNLNLRRGPLRGNMDREADTPGADDDVLGTAVTVEIRATAQQNWLGAAETRFARRFCSPCVYSKELLQ